MLNLHLQAAEQEIIKIIPLVLDLQVTLGRRHASSCSKQNGFFAQEDYASISREHAILKVDSNQRLYIADAGSKLGTFINGKRISHETSPYTHLKTGDVLVRAYLPGASELQGLSQRTVKTLGSEVPFRVVECPCPNPPCICLTKRTPKVEKVRSSRLNQQLSYQPRDEDIVSLASEAEDITVSVQPPVERPSPPTPTRIPTPSQSPLVVSFPPPPDEPPPGVTLRGVFGPDQTAFPPPVENLLWSALENLSPGQNTVSDLPVEDEEEFTLLSQALPGHIRLDGHDMANAPLATRDAINAGAQLVQYGLLGQVINLRSPNRIVAPRDGRLYVNTNAPFTAVICGVQGSGKSHSSSILLESMFVADRRIGFLQQPLCGLVLHFGEGGADSKPCEAAFLSQSHQADESFRTPPVVVYVSKSSIKTMEKIYGQLPNVKVEVLRFSEEELDASGLLTLMAVGNSSENAPLYIQSVLSILRDLGEDFTFTRFKKEIEIKKKTFNPSQKSGLEQRMVLLESFLDTSAAARFGYYNKVTSRLRFTSGQLTIVDLSDRPIDHYIASALFDIIIRNFERANVGTGKVLLVDEAHKYLSSAVPKYGLANTLLSLSRQQRHQSMRLIISTQEPTVIPPVLLDLCTVAIIHRFSSLSWWNHLSNHLAAEFEPTTFDAVVRLQTGEAILVAPSSLVAMGASARGTLQQLGRRYMLVRTRKRLTADGGKSRLVIDLTTTM